MKVVVEDKLNHRDFDIEYTIGDIVKVTEYGDRWAAQEKVFSGTVFPIANVPFNGKHEVSETSYLECNEVFHDLEWKITDIGYFVGNSNDKLSERRLVIRLIDRFKREMLMVYDSIDYDHSLKVVRKSKKEIEEYTINIY